MDSVFKGGLGAGVHVYIADGAVNEDTFNLYCVVYCSLWIKFSLIN